MSSKHSRPKMNARTPDETGMLEFGEISALLNIEPKSNHNEETKFIRVRRSSVPNTTSQAPNKAPVLKPRTPRTSARITQNQNLVHPELYGSLRNQHVQDSMNEQAENYEQAGQIRFLRMLLAILTSFLLIICIAITSIYLKPKPFQTLQTTPPVTETSSLTDVPDVTLEDDVDTKVDEIVEVKPAPKPNHQTRCKRKRNKWRKSCGGNGIRPQSTKPTTTTAKGRTRTLRIKSNAKQATVSCDGYKKRLSLGGGSATFTQVPNTKCRVKFSPSGLTRTVAKGKTSMKCTLDATQSSISCR